VSQRNVMLFHLQLTYTAESTTLVRGRLWSFPQFNYSYIVYRRAFIKANSITTERKEVNAKRLGRKPCKTAFVYKYGVTRGTAALCGRHNNKLLVSLMTWNFSRLLLLFSAV